MNIETMINTKVFQSKSTVHRSKRAGVACRFFSYLLLGMMTFSAMGDEPIPTHIEKSHVRTPSNSETNAPILAPAVSEGQKAKNTPPEVALLGLLDDDAGTQTDEGVEMVSNMRLPQNYFSNFPNEKITLQSLGVRYQYDDVYVPGPAGMDMKVTRKYAEGAVGFLPGFGRIG